MTSTAGVYANEMCFMLFQVHSCLKAELYSDTVCIQTSLLSMQKGNPHSEMFRPFPGISSSVARSSPAPLHGCIGGLCLVSLHHECSSGATRSNSTTMSSRPVYCLNFATILSSSALLKLNSFGRSRTVIRFNPIKDTRSWYIHSADDASYCGLIVL